VPGKTYARLDDLVRSRAFLDAISALAPNCSQCG